MLVRKGHFGEGQIDGAIGIYRPPHGLMKTIFSYNKQSRNNLLHENEEYKSGFKLACRKQTTITHLI